MKEPRLRLNCLRWFSLCIILFYGTISLAQDTLRVTVYDKDGNILPGVTVVSPTYQNISNEDGQLMIPTEPSSIFEFSYLGYRNQAISTTELIASRGVVFMEVETNLLSEIIVVGRTDAYQQEITQQVDLIPAEVLLQSGVQTTADAMGAHGQVFVQKSQMGGGSPIIRGFEANKVLLVVDGVRMNNAIYRSGHLQNVITVSSFMLDQLEVIYGPGSLMYGSDALGGVIHFRTKNPSFAGNEPLLVKSTIGARYASSNQEKTAYGSIQLGGRKLASMTSFSLSDFDDLRAGSNRKKYPDFGKLFDYVERVNGQDQIIQNNRPNLQRGTGYAQWDFLQKLLFQPNPKSTYTLNVQWSNSSNIPRYDQLALRDDDGIPVFSAWYYGPQQRKLISLKGQYNHQTSFFDYAQWIVAFQDIDEDRHSRNFQDGLLENRREDLQAWNMNLDFDKVLSSRLNLNLEYGLEYIYNRLESRAFLENVSSGQINQVLSTRYPNGDNSWHTQGVYAIIQKYSKDEKTAFHIGARFSAAQLSVSYQPGDGFVWPENFYTGIKSDNAQGTTSAGMRFESENGFQLNLLTSTAFRAPNIDDFAKVRVKDNDATVPNIDLKPEKSINAEITFQQDFNIKSSDGLTLSSTFFITRLRDAIIRRDYTLPDGSNTITINNRSYNAQANVNANKALLYGISGQFNLVYASFDLQGSINYIQGESEDNGEILPLAHIPPLYGSLVANFHTDRWRFQTGYFFNGAKPLSDYAPGSSDNEEYATPEGTLSWGIINLSSQFALNSTISVQAGIDNLFDIHYRPFSSGVSAPGRNFRVGFQADF